MRSGWKSLVVITALWMGGGCKDDDEPVPPPPKPEEPTLSDTPLWQVKDTPSDPLECFGSSVALGDFNGDGRQDLVVGTRPCFVLMRVAKHPGRVSIFQGEESFFSKQPVSALMTWRSTHPRASGDNLRAVAGDVNGDRYADLLVSSGYGVNVFLGQADLVAMLREPAFSVPVNLTLRSTPFLDLNGDGRGDFVVSTSQGQEFYLATPGAPEGLFTRALVREGFHTASSVGDLNGDGADDVLLSMEGGGQGYFLGCKPGASFRCNGPISAEPLRVESRSVNYGILPDMNGDGHRESFISTDTGLLQLHLSERDGSPAQTAVWSTPGDPAFPAKGTVLRAVGDLDGDGLRNDFVVGALGRLYFFSPKDGVSESLKPVWAWPRADSIPNGYGDYRRYSVATPGDLDKDGIDDLIVATSSYGDSDELSKGDVSIYAGGKVPTQPDAPPYLPAPKSCGLAMDPVNGKPDLTVDAETLRRTAHVKWRTFAADACEVKEQCVNAPGRRKLLSFSTSILNLGSKAAILPPIGENPDLYVFDACHGHDHLINFAAYELLDSNGRTALAGRKQGFALVDVHSYCSDAAPADYTYDPMGISPGWADIYTLDTPCQWVDVTDLPDGNYTFKVSVDTRDIVDEGTAHPNTVGFPVRLEGDTVTVLP